MTLPGASLGNTTRFVSPLGDLVPEQAQKARLKRFALQSVARELLPDERVSWCLRRLGFQKESVEVWVAEKVQRAHLKNLICCGSVWNCPVCAAKITERRRVEMTEALEKNRGRFTPVLVTLTFQHERADKLQDLVEALAKAWRSFRQGKAWVEISKKYGFEASVTGSEVTWGQAAGWHPHKHALFFSSLSENEIDVDELQGVLAARWQAVLGRLNEYAHSDVGVRVQIGDEKAGDYVGKWGVEFELAKAPVKKGRDGHFSPFQLLQLFAEGEKWAGPLFREYAAVFKGRRQLVWSRGARAHMGLEEHDKTDQELVEQAEEASYLFAQLTWLQYKRIIQVADGNRKSVIGELLEVASHGDPDVFWDWLAQFGVVASDDQRVKSLYPWLVPQNMDRDIEKEARRVRLARVEDLWRFRAERRKRQKKKRKWVQSGWL